jgi:hypothetical protein
MHKARHTAITEFLRDTGNLTLAQMLAGHADISTTANVYTHLDTHEEPPGGRRRRRRGRQAIVHALPPRGSRRAGSTSRRRAECRTRADLAARQQTGRAPDRAPEGRTTSSS